MREYALPFHHDKRSAVKVRLRFASGLSAVAAAAVLTAVGLLLFLPTLTIRPFTEAGIIRDLMRLDVWSLLFLAVIAILWRASGSRTLKSWLLIACFAVFGFTSVAVIFSGTSFGLNAFNGDQTFRQAMVLRFMTDWLPSDYFFKDLPASYPPAYYWLLSLWGRVFSVEAFKLLKVGHLLVFLLGPPVLFCLWKTVVSKPQAALITVATFLFAGFAKTVAFVSPPAFVGNMMFIPWWLRYVEQVRAPRSNRAAWIGGGLLGAVIFTTYPYAFLIGGLVFVLRAAGGRFFFWLKLPDRYGRLRLYGAALMTVLFSMPYWLPALISIVRFGSKPADQAWYHIGHPGVRFQFLELSWLGLLFLLGILWSVRRARSRVHRALLMLLAGTITFYFIGTLLGLADRPINIPKAKEFILFFGGPMVGLALASVHRFSGRFSPRLKTVCSVSGLLILLPFLNDLNSLANNDMVRTARKAEVPSWSLNNKVMDARKNAVFLTPHMSLSSFYPVYQFLPVNQHFANPACRYEDRFDLLYLSQQAGDPGLFHLLLCYNRFDRVDFFMPARSRDSLKMTVHLSDYPDGHFDRELYWPLRYVQDDRCFRREADGYDLYRVLPDWAGAAGGYFDGWSGTTSDSLVALLRASLVSPLLSDSGQHLLRGYVGAGWSSWVSLLSNGEPIKITEDVGLERCCVASQNDSLFLLSCLRVSSGLDTDARVFVHLDGPFGNTTFLNRDFTPNPPPKRWLKGDLILCCQYLTSESAGFDLSMGLFDGSERLGRTFRAHYKAPPFRPDF